MCVCVYVCVCVCVCVCVFFFRFLSLIGHYKTLSIVPCAIRQVLTGYLFYIS